MFSKELFNSSIFSREEILKIKNENIIIARTGNKVIIEKLPEMNNKYKIKNSIERIITVLLKTAMIEKECIKRLNKFILDGPK